MSECKNVMVDYFKALEVLKLVQNQMVLVSRKELSDEMDSFMRNEKREGRPPYVENHPLWDKIEKNEKDMVAFDRVMELLDTNALKIKKILLLEGPL